MLFMVWLRLGSTCIKETIRETAKSIASISNGLFKRWQEREKTQGPQKKKTRKKINTENNIFSWKLLIQLIES